MIKTLFIFSYSINFEGHIPWSTHNNTDTWNLPRNYFNFHLSRFTEKVRKRKFSWNRNKEIQHLAKFISSFVKNGNWGESLISSKVLSLKTHFQPSMRSFVFVLNHRFCLNTASDWSVIFTVSRCLKIPTAFPSMSLKSLSKQLCLKQFYTF